MHSLNALFAQLGLPADDAAIASFVRTHTLPPGTLLQDGSFWTPSQRTLLQSEICVDADWAGVVDQLNVLLAA
ncbi:MAG: DUF2789 domain-containing protein [Rhodocyclaceae bacterium]